MNELENNPHPVGQDVLGPEYANGDERPVYRKIGNWIWKNAEKIGNTAAAVLLPAAVVGLSLYLIQEEPDKKPRPPSTGAVYSSASTSKMEGNGLNRLYSEGSKLELKDFDFPGVRKDYSREFLTENLGPIGYTDEDINGMLKAFNKWSTETGRSREVFIAQAVQEYGPRENTERPYKGLLQVFEETAREVYRDSMNQYPEIKQLCGEGSKKTEISIDKLAESPECNIAISALYGEHLENNLFNYRGVDTERVLSEPLIWDHKDGKILYQLGNNVHQKKSEENRDLFNSPLTEETVFTEEYIRKNGIPDSETLKAYCWGPGNYGKIENIVNKGDYVWNILRYTLQQLNN